jgi:hypothetical protein
MDQRTHKGIDDFSSTYDMSIGNIVQCFKELERLRKMETENKLKQEEYEQVVKKRDELQLEIEQLRILPTHLQNEEQKQRNKKIG